MLIHGEGNGTPLQYSCLENPMDGGAWWAAVHGVAQSRTRLNWLSSSSSSSVNSLFKFSFTLTARDVKYLLKISICLLVIRILTSVKLFLKLDFFFHLSVLLIELTMYWDLLLSVCKYHLSLSGLSLYLFMESYSKQKFLILM